MESNSVAGGETIKEMQNSTGCRINVLSQSHPSDPEREIQLSGSPDSIQRARAAIEEKVDNAVCITMFIVLGSANFSKQMQGQPKGNDYGSGDNQNYQQGLGAYGAPPKPAASGPGATDPANDPYQAYGGYQAYAQMYYAALLAQQQQQGQSATPGENRPPGT